MADDDNEKKNKNAEESADYDRNPDLASATSGMVDLSDILAGDDSDVSTSISSVSDKSEEEEPEEKDELDDVLAKARDMEPVEGKDLPILFRIRAKLFPIDSKQRLFVIRVKRFFSTAAKAVKENSVSGKAKILKFLREDSKQIAQSSLSYLLIEIKKMGQYLQKYWKLSWKLKLSFVGLLIAAYGIFYVVQFVLQRHLISKPKDPYLSNFNERADHIYDIDPEARWEEFRNPLRFPEYIVKFDRLIVVLRKSKHSSSNPMAVTSVYYEASSQEAAIEIKRREAEVRDISARTLEDMTYDQLRTAEGKNKAKILLAQNINKSLTQGKITKVYFKDFVAKP